MKQTKYFVLKDKTDRMYPWFISQPDAPIGVWPGYGWAGEDRKNDRMRFKTREEAKKGRKRVRYAFGGEPAIVRVVRKYRKPRLFIKRTSDGFYFQPGKVVGGHCWSLQRKHDFKAGEVKEVLKNLRATYPKETIKLVKVT